MTDDTCKDDCWREALALLLRWQAEPENEGIKREITEFCAQGDDHIAAWLEAKKVYRIGGIALDAGSSARAAKSFSRRQVILSLGALVFVSGALAHRSRHVLPDGMMRTQVAEVREITLDDGTRISAGPYTTFSLSFDESQRALELEDGLIYCSPAPDHRPFILKMPKMTVSCSNAAVEATADEHNCCVTAADGAAQVRFEPGRAADDEINAGEWIRIGDDKGIERGQGDPSQAGQWRTGTLVVDNESVAAVIGRIARWQNSKILIPQQRLATARVSGLYDLSDPLLAMQAVIGPHGGHVRKVAPWTVVLSTI